MKDLAGSRLLKLGIAAGLSSLGLMVAMIRLQWEVLLYVGVLPALLGLGVAVAVTVGRDQPRRRRIAGGATMALNLAMVGLYGAAYYAFATLL